jgi:2-succinyl-6-hydroxy-2,4-cyclohexadiene-1-carboxylate synthase
MSRPIVLLHGFLGTPRSFAGVVRLLPKTLPVFSPALFGHRGCPEAEDDHSFDAEVERLLTDIRARFAETPVHVGGYSLGGRLALALLVKAPEQFHSATLISSRRGLDEPVQRRQRLEHDRRWAEMLSSMPLPKFLTIWEQQPLFANQQALAPDVTAALRKERLTHNPTGLAQAMLALSLARMPSLQQELERIRCSVALVVGERDPKFRDLAHDLANRIPNSRTIVVSGAGHNLPLERPDMVAAAICEGIDYVKC